MQSYRFFVISIASAILGGPLATGCAGGEPAGEADDTGAAAQTATVVHRVLFDAGHLQVAGNAFWIIDGDAPSPVPASPTSANSWSGGISAWGFGLFASGRYTIKQLPSGSTLTWGRPPRRLGRSFVPGRSCSTPPRGSPTTAHNPRCVCGVHGA
jgi:hypothetical protein